MGAIVHVGVVATAEVHGEAFHKPFAPDDVKLRRAAGRDFCERSGPHSIGVHRRQSFAGRARRGRDRGGLLVSTSTGSASTVRRMAGKFQ